MKPSWPYRIFQGFNTCIMTLVCVACLYPFLYTIAVSLSNTDAVLGGRVFLLPVGFNVSAYRTVVYHPSFAIGYYNTIRYTFFGTLVGLFMTTLCAYSLSKDGLMLGTLIKKIMLFTMYFGGGLIPNFLLITRLHLIDTIWAIVLPGAVNTYYMILMMSFFRGIPSSLEEAAAIDGLNPIQSLVRIVLPLSKPVMATIGLFYAVAFWNDWFNAMIYLNSSDRTPIMLLLRNIVMGAELAAMQPGGIKDRSSMEAVSATYKSASIVLSTLPILLLYPFLQKHFVKGVMIGAIKG